MKYAGQELDHNAHSIGEATVHLCWIPWKRKKILKGKIKDRLYEIFAEVALEKGWVIRAVTIEDDHVHIFVKHQPKYSVGNIARAFKGRSSRFIRAEFPEMRKMPSFWTHSYCYRTAGQISAAVVEKYINDSHHHG